MFVSLGTNKLKKCSDGKILETDVVIAKNYLSEEEIKELNNLVSMYLDFAERQVKLGHIISMQEWKEKLEMFLNLNEYNILKDNGKIKREIADKLALDEYEKYRVVQDQKYISDFDELILETKNIELQEQCFLLHTDYNILYVERNIKIETKERKNENGIYKKRKS